MSDCAVRIEGLSKVFRVWRRPSDMFVETITGRRRHADFAALTDVSFEVKKGSVYGVLGRNGAGKSTLLRIVAGTLDATGGAVEVRGRTAAILELGTGFHPEYSGRENVYLGGLCLGLTRAEIDARFEEIVAFAELEDFIDQPFRTFSSGMQARLTFAVATSVDPDVLIIDEALAVGDARFTLKSFDRVRDFARRGKSILFVSHDINQVMSFCDEALVLEKGRVFAKGDPQKVGNIYHELLFGDRASALVKPAEPPAGAALELAPSSTLETEEIDIASMPPEPPGSAKEHRYGDRRAVITDFYIRDLLGRRVTRLESLARYEIVVAVRANEPVEDVSIGFLFRTQRGMEVYGADSVQTHPAATIDLGKGETATATVAFRNNLAPGNYFVTASLARSDTHKHDLRFDALEVAVDPVPGVYHASIVNLEMKFAFKETVAERT